MQPSAAEDREAGCPSEQQATEIHAALEVDPGLSAAGLPGLRRRPRASHECDEPGRSFTTAEKAVWRSGARLSTASRAGPRHPPANSCAIARADGEAAPREAPPYPGTRAALAPL